MLNKGQYIIIRIATNDLNCRLPGVCIIPLKQKMNTPIFQQDALNHNGCRTEGSFLITRNGSYYGSDYKHYSKFDIACQTITKIITSTLLIILHMWLATMFAFIIIVAILKDASLPQVSESIPKLDLVKKFECPKNPSLYISNAHYPHRRQRLPHLFTPLNVSRLMNNGI